MTTDTGSEIPQREGIQFFKPGEPLNLLYAEFEKTITIARLGEVQICGSRASIPDDEDKGIKIEKNGLAKQDAQELWDNEDLYELIASIANSSRSKMECAVNISGKKFTSSMDFDDEIPYGNDPLRNNLHVSTKWKTDGDPNEYVIFVPADPKLLSELRFSFRSIPNEPTETQK